MKSMHRWGKSQGESNWQAQLYISTCFFVFLSWTWLNLMCLPSSYIRRPGHYSSAYLSVSGIRRYFARQYGLLFLVLSVNSEIIIISNIYFLHFSQACVKAEDGLEEVKVHAACARDCHTENSYYYICMQQPSVIRCCWSLGRNLLRKIILLIKGWQRIRI